MQNKHEAHHLRQMQMLPLEAKIRMSKDRIKVWHDAWVKYEIYNTNTNKTRFVTSDEEPQLKEHEYIVSALDGQVYVGLSGGKDSTVLKHLVDSMYGDVPAVFANTGLEYPEIQTFVRQIKAGRYNCFNSNVEIVRPEMRFDEVIKKYGYPVIGKEVAQIIREAKIGLSRNDGSYKYRIQKITGTGVYAPKNGKKSRYDVSKYQHLLQAPFDVSEQCCKVMKKNPSRRYEKETGRKPILGTMASESALRYQRWLKYGCNAFSATGGQQASNPLSFWTEQDILQYIKKFNVPYCPIYGDIVVDDDSEYADETQITIFDILGDYEGAKLKTTGVKRTGCIFCMFGCHLEKGPNRFQRLKETHPKQYDFCINGGEVVDGKWQPNKEGLGCGKVLDYIGVGY